MNEILEYLSAGDWDVHFYGKSIKPPEDCGKFSLHINHRQHGAYTAWGNTSAEALTNAMAIALWAIGGK